MQVVALLAEGVDRNTTLFRLGNRKVESPSSRRAWIEIYHVNHPPIHHLVALLAEGVDRNQKHGLMNVNSPSSPSSRRAWIEIALLCHRSASGRRSPSSQRAWIEIFRRGYMRNRPRNVALLAEGVDRNFTAPIAQRNARRSPSSRRAWIEIVGSKISAQRRTSRPPRGGRG